MSLFILNINILFILKIKKSDIILIAIDSLTLFEIFFLLNGIIIIFCSTIEISNFFWLGSYLLLFKFFFGAFYLRLVYLLFN